MNANELTFEQAVEIISKSYFLTSSSEKVFSIN